MHQQPNTSGHTAVGIATASTSAAEEPLGALRHTALLLVGSLSFAGFTLAMNELLNVAPLPILSAYIAISSLALLLPVLWLLDRLAGCRASRSETLEVATDDETLRPSVVLGVRLAPWIVTAAAAYCFAVACEDIGVLGQTIGTAGTLLFVSLADCRVDQTLAVLITVAGCALCAVGESAHLAPDHMRCFLPTIIFCVALSFLLRAFHQLQRECSWHSLGSMGAAAMCFSWPVLLAAHVTGLEALRRPDPSTFLLLLALGVSFLGWAASCRILCQGAGPLAAALTIPVSNPLIVLAQFAAVTSSMAHFVSWQILPGAILIVCGGISIYLSGSGRNGGSTTGAAIHQVL
jgi:hypothetical protein